MNFIEKIIITLFVSVGAAFIGITTHYSFGLLLGLVPLYFIAKEK